MFSFFCNCSQVPISREELQICSEMQQNPLSPKYAEEVNLEKIEEQRTKKDMERLLEHLSLVEEKIGNLEERQISLKEKIGLIIDRLEISIATNLETTHDRGSDSGGQRYDQREDHRGSDSGGQRYDQREDHRPNIKIVCKKQLKYGLFFGEYSNPVAIFHLHGYPPILKAEQATKTSISSSIQNLSFHSYENPFGKIFFTISFKSLETLKIKAFLEYMSESQFNQKLNYKALSPIKQKKKYL